MCTDGGWAKILAQTFAHLSFLCFHWLKISPLFLLHNWLLFCKRYIKKHNIIPNSIAGLIQVSFSPDFLYTKISKRVPWGSVSYDCKTGKVIKLWFIKICNMLYLNGSCCWMSNKAETHWFRSLFLGLVEPEVAILVPFWTCYCQIHFLLCPRFMKFREKKRIL